MAMVESCLLIARWCWGCEMTSHEYPLPQVNAETRVFWEGCASGELRYQRCAACNHVQLIPRSLCERCQSRELRWQVSGRNGRVLAFTLVHRAALPVFKAMAPYLIAIVDMDEGFRLMVNARKDIQDRVAMESQVRIGFQDVEGAALPIIDSVLLEEET